MAGKNGKKYRLNNQSKTICEWCKEFKVSENLVRSRLRCGWKMRDALTSPTRTYKVHDYNETAIKNGISYQVYRNRLKEGWTQEEATTTPPRKYPTRISNISKELDISPRNTWGIIKIYKKGVKLDKIVQGYFKSA